MDIYTYMCVCVVWGKLNFAHFISSTTTHAHTDTHSSRTITIYDKCLCPRIVGESDEENGWQRMNE